MGLAPYGTDDMYKELRKYIIEKVNVTTFHGGGVVYNKIAFLFIGDKFSGKSHINSLLNQ